MYIDDLKYLSSLQGKFDEEHNEEYSNGYILDCMLEILEEKDSKLHLKILNTDGENLSDSGAIDLVRERYFIK